MLQLQSLVVGYHGVRGAVLSNLNVTAAPGEFICVLGRNGSGKSTLMRTIAALQVALAGHVWVDADDVFHLSASERAQRIAVVLTERISSPGLTVDDVVLMGRQPFTGWRGHISNDDAEICQAALESAGAATFAGRLFDSLSDGERQRVMIARAIAQTPRLMVLDEITAFLDLPGRVEVMSLLRRHARATGTVILLSSHDLDLSLQLADTVWLLEGSGQFTAASPKELIASNAISRAFDSANVHFSAEHGRFQLKETMK